MADVVFTYNERISYSYATRVARNALYVPLFGRFNRNQITSHADRLVRAWRARLAGLREAGWHPAGDLRKFSGARNCRPSIVFTDQVTRHCGLWFCPFCWGRKVVEYYKRIVPVLTWPRPEPVHSVVDRLVRFAPTPRPGADPVGEVVGYLSDLSGMRQRILAKVKPEGAFLISLPVIGGKQVKFDIRQLFMVGINSEEHYCLETMPGRYGPVPTTTVGLIREFSKLLSYPASWLRSPPELMLRLIQARARRKTQLFATIGAFRNPEDPNARPANYDADLALGIEPNPYAIMQRYTDPIERVREEARVRDILRRYEENRTPDDLPVAPPVDPGAAV